MEAKTMDKNKVLMWVAVAVIVLTAILVYANSSFNKSNVLSFLKIGSSMSPSAIAQKSVDYLNKSVLQQGQTATLVSSDEESGVVHFKIKVGGSTYDSYATNDGKLVFPEAFTVNAAAAAAAPAASSTTNTTTSAQITPANVPKVASTMLDAYVVSSCPYGLQMQRALANAIQTIPALAKYVTVRYIGAVSGNTITSMHGLQEAQENLRQICIRQEQPAVYWPYVSCYMQTVAGTMANGMPYGDTAKCQTQAGVDSAKLNACVADPSRGLAYAQADFNLDTKYNVTGSPTLVLNGTTIDETPFGGRSASAMESIICSSSTNPPSFCSTKLNTAQAAYSFSLTYANTTATTGSTSATNCAPAAN